MRVPSLHRHSVWYTFLSGIIIGGCIAWVIFLFIFSTIQERHTTTIDRQHQEISDLEDKIMIWQEDFNALNVKNQEILTVQDIKIMIINGKKYSIDDSNSLFEAQESIKKDLSSLLANDLISIYENRELIKRIVENKILTIHNRKYRLETKELYFYTTITLVLELKLAN